MPSEGRETDLEFIEILRASYTQKEMWELILSAEFKMGAL